MGNKNVKYQPLNLPFATYYELNDLYLKKYTASGDTMEQCLDNLYGMCKINGIPEPLSLENNYYCGTIRIMNTFKVVKKYNTVFWKKRNGRYFALVFYEPI